MNRILHENSKKYYKQCKALFIKDIKEIKLTFSKEDIKELKLLNDDSLCIKNLSKIHKYETIVFLLFKFYYIIKKKDNQEHRLTILFRKNKTNIEYIKYLRIFYIIIDKIIINSNKKKHIFLCIFRFNLVEGLDEDIENYYLHEMFLNNYIEYIETFFL